jgi:hypothetical protein
MIEGEIIAKERLFIDCAILCRINFCPVWRMPMKHFITAISLFAATACNAGYVHPMHQGMFRANCDRRQLKCARQIIHTCPDGIVALNENGSMFMCSEGNE